MWLFGTRRCIGVPREVLQCPPKAGYGRPLSTSLALPAYCSACGRPGTHTQQRAYFVLFLSWGDRKRQVSVGSIQAKKVGLVQQGARGVEVQLLGLSPRQARPLRNCLSFLSVEGSPVVLPYLTAQLS